MSHRSDSLAAGLPLAVERGHTPVSRAAAVTRLLRLCYVAFALLAVVYGLATPVFEASDESRHFAVIDYIKHGGGLPEQHPGEESAWMQEGSQPPLYYFLAVAATFWIDTSDLPQYERYNPHAFVGLPEALDNRNLVLHGDGEGFPWRGTALAVHIIRLLGALMGLGTLLCVTGIAREVAPGREEIALGATALVAFNPMMLFVSGSVNNDNLTILFGCLALLLGLRIWRLGVSLRRAAWLGVAIGASSLAKVGGLALIPLAFAAIGAASWRDRKWREGIAAGAIILMLVAVIAGWWYGRNKLLYDEWLGLWTMSIQATQRPGAPVSLLELIPEWQGFRYSYWGVFGAFNIILPGWLYHAYDILLIIAAIGLSWELAARLKRPGRIRLGTLIADYGHLVPLALIALQVVVTMTGIVRWTSLTKASQGRLLFPAIGGIATLIMLGLMRWMRLLSPSRHSPDALPAAVFLSLTLFAVAAVVPFALIAPAYVPPQPVAEASIPEDARIAPIRLGEQFELVGMTTGPDHVAPGEVWEVTVWWQATAPTDADYVAFAHVRGRDFAKLGEVNRYPASGWTPTSQWRVGDLWQDTFRIRIPPDALAPTLIQAEVGLWDASAQSNLAAVASDGATLHRVVAGEAKLAGRAPGATASPSATRFGDHIALESITFSTEPSIAAGGVLTATLNWIADGRPSRAYTAFVHLVGDGDRRIAQADGQPLGAQYPTSVWDAGERIADPHILHIPADAPPGVYRLLVGLYLLETGERLPVFDANGQIVADHLAWPAPITILKRP
jgi:4-amino-4-deoxy-L-arabinose transferase-like glycosyltransferase